MDTTTTETPEVPQSGNFVDTMRKLGPVRLAVMAGVLFFLIIMFVFLSFRVTGPSMISLYSDLPPEEANQISVKLDSAGIASRLSPTGDSIMVPESEASKARLLLAEEGLPSAGASGYELFDNQSGFGTTNFQDMINKKRSLEGELQRTINGIGSVATSRVHLVLPERQLFSRDASNASGSVFLNLRGSSKLSAEQVLSIQSLVASAVPDMSAGDVSVMDSNGNLLARGGQDEEALLTVKADEMRMGYEKRLTRSIEDLVSRVVGFGNVQAVVTAQLNFDRISQNEEIFDPESQVARSTQILEESSSETDAPDDSVSVENNLPAAAGDLLGGVGDTAQSNRVEETTNFEISRTTRNTIREGGEIENLSVAVLVDGTYTVDAEGNQVYAPRDEETLAKIETLVRSAVGFDDSRGDVITIESMQFAEIDAGAEAEDSRLFGFERSDLLDAAEIMVIAIMVLLVILLVLQPMIGKMFETVESSKAASVEGGGAHEMLPGGQLNPALAAPDSADFVPSDVDENDSLIDMSQVEGKVKASSVRKVEDIVENYPNETVSVLRSWMGQE